MASSALWILILSLLAILQPSQAGQGGSVTACGLQSKWRAPSNVAAGKVMAMKFAVRNRLGQDVNNIVFKLQLPVGTSFKKGKAKGGYGPPRLETGNIVAWRGITLRRGKTIIFGVRVQVNCDVVGSVTFTPATIVEGVCSVPYAPVQVPVKGRISPRWNHKCVPTQREPLVQNVSVPDLNTNPSPIPPEGEWTTGGPSVNIDSENAIVPIDFRRQLLSSFLDVGVSATSYALKQQTMDNVEAQATAGIYYMNVGLFNGMLFKDFVLQGCQIVYDFNVRAAPAGKTTQYAPDLYIMTMSRITGRFSTYKWDPFYNQDSQDPIVYQAWNTDRMTQATGSSDPWPMGATGGSGWSCTFDCYLVGNQTSSVSQMRRSLQTYVNALLAQPATSISKESIDTAIITGIQLVLGPNEPNTTSYVRTTTVASGAYSWSWNFGPGSLSGRV